MFGYVEVQETSKNLPGKLFSCSTWLDTVKVLINPCHSLEGNEDPAKEGAKGMCHICSYQQANEAIGTSSFLHVLMSSNLFICKDDCTSWTEEDIHDFISYKNILQATPPLKHYVWI